MVDLQDPNLIAIIIIDIVGISIFIWFLASRLSMKFKVIEERKSRKKNNNLKIDDGNSNQDPQRGQD